MRRTPGALRRPRERDHEQPAREQDDEEEGDRDPARPPQRDAPTPYFRANPAISSSFSASDVFVAFSPAVHGGLR
jgi:hypothetical protein